MMFFASILATNNNITFKINFGDFYSRLGFTELLAMPIKRGFECRNVAHL